ncbi:hypothetical protein BKA69DRAFT_645114 [Paraphysoderma sedebokerense]|nr:hypothetical protein BKA69DRAFT_645114 [Paraphysoderma sedebokerense]
MSAVDPETYTAYYTLVGVYNAYMLSTTLVLWYFRRLEFLQKRQPLVLVFHAIVAWLTGNELVGLFTYKEIHWLNVKTGHIGTYVILYTCTPLWLLCYFLRCISLVSQYYGNAIHVTETQLNLVERSIFRFLKFFARDKRVSFDTTSTSSTVKLTENTNVVTFKLKSFIKTISVVMIIEVVMLLIALGYTKCYNPDGKCLNLGARKAGYDMAAVFAFISIYVLLLPYFLYLIRKVKDSFFLRLELQITLCTFLVMFTLFIIDWYSTTFNTINPYHGYLWLLIGLLLCHTVSVVIPVIAAVVLKYGKEKVLLNHSIEACEKILNDRRLSVEFRKSLAEDFCIENGLFWEDWKGSFSTHCSLI